MPSKAKKVREMEHRLGEHYYTLSGEMAHLDSGAVLPTVPASEWRTPKTRMLGIMMPKLDPSPGESVFVMLLARNRFDIDAIAAEIGEHPDLLRALYERPAVSAAVELWHKKKVLPLAPSQG